MCLFCCRTCPFFDKYEFSGARGILHKLITQTSCLSASWLDDCREDLSNLSDLVLLGFDARNDSKRSVRHHGFKMVAEGQLLI